jgi:hypothetical protein
VRNPPAQPTYTPQRHAPVARPSGTPQRHAPASGTPQWHAPAARSSSTPQWHAPVARPSGTPQWHAPVARSSSTPQWQLIQRQPHEAQCFIVSQVNGEPPHLPYPCVSSKSVFPFQIARGSKPSSRSKVKPQRPQHMQELIAPASPSGKQHQR